jgi:non-heme chloroperoxidase
MSSPKATVECTDTFAKTDTRSGLASFTLPTLIIHGTAEKIVPSEPSGRAAASGIAGAQIIEYHGEPHGLFATVPTRLSEELIRFIA